MRAEHAGFGAVDVVDGFEIHSGLNGHEIVEVLKAHLPKVFEAMEYAINIMPDDECPIFLMHKEGRRIVPVQEEWPSFTSYHSIYVGTNLQWRKRILWIGMFFLSVRHSLLSIDRH